MMHALRIALALVLAISVAAPATLAGAVVADEGTPTPTEPSCDTEVAHDAFLSEESASEFNKTGTVADIERNTRVTIEETSAFYRLRAENPNSYCVHTTVSISADILPPTNLGTVRSNNEVAKAEWVDIRDFDRQTVHTEVTFVMPPNSTVLFAPSKPTVLIPAWRDDKKHKATGLFGSIKESFDDDSPLEKRQYKFSSDGSPSVTIPLRSENDSEQRITEWQAVYRTSETEPWAPVDRETDAPVFYQEVDDGNKVRFYFNAKDAEVDFRANPTMKDSAVWEYRSFKRSLHDLGGLWPFGMVSPIDYATLEVLG